MENALLMPVLLVQLLSCGANFALVALQVSSHVLNLAFDGCAC